MNKKQGFMLRINKKGQTYTNEELVKIVLAVLAIIAILIPLGYKMYQGLYVSQDVLQARETVKQVLSMVNSMKLGVNQSMILTGQQNWFLYAGTNKICAGYFTNGKWVDTKERCLESKERGIEVTGYEEIGGKIFDNHISLYLTEIKFTLTEKDGKEIVKIDKKSA
jgi:hypothetical protein